MPSPLPPVVRIYLDTLTGHRPINYLELAVSEAVTCEIFTDDRSTKIKGRSALAQIIKQRRVSFKELTISADVDRVDGDCLHVTFRAAGIVSRRHAYSSTAHGFDFVHDVAARYRIYAGRITEIAEHWTSRHAPPGR
jgi:hypothetical protein